jgi:recombinational DNA repair ATPase RecF
MRIDRVRAIAFGPFKGADLELARGMTVVHGPNEAGKSSWHAAVYAALCGMRRGGGLRKEDKAFAARHRPWDEEGWEVAAELTLDNGDRVELRQDSTAGWTAARPTWTPARTCRRPSSTRGHRTGHASSG